METLVKTYHFFVGGNRFETDKPFLTGSEIKRLAAVRAEYQLFFRDDVNTPDREVRDTQAVDLIEAKEDPLVDQKAVPWVVQLVDHLERWMVALQLAC